MQITFMHNNNTTALLIAFVASYSSTYNEPFSIRNYGGKCNINSYMILPPFTKKILIENGLLSIPIDHTFPCRKSIIFA